MNHDIQMIRTYIYSIVNKQNKRKEERKINQKSEVEIREEFYEESSHFSQVDHTDGGYIEGDTVDFRPSTNRDKSNEFKFIKQDTPELKNKNKDIRDKYALYR